MFDTSMGLPVPHIGWNSDPPSLSRSPILAYHNPLCLAVLPAQRTTTTPESRVRVWDVLLTLPCLPCPSPDSSRAAEALHSTEQP